MRGGNGTTESNPTVSGVQERCKGVPVIIKSGGRCRGAARETRSHLWGDRSLAVRCQLGIIALIEELPLYWYRDDSLAARTSVYRFIDWNLTHPKVTHSEVDILGKNVGMSTLSDKTATAGPRKNLELSSITSL